MARFLGIDIGAEYCKIAELVPGLEGLQLKHLRVFDHGKKPGPALLEALREFDWESVTAAAVCGRFAPQVNLPRMPAKQAQLAGYHFLFGNEPATVVTIGSQGFSVLEVAADGVTRFRENSRCSQGTGNFLRQLVERFSLTVEEAGILCAEVDNPAPLSGRCPVILKTDMTHLANKGEDRAKILAGLFDAVCENVLLLVKPSGGSKRVLLVGGVSRSPRIRRVMRESLARRGMELELLGEDEGVCLEALGCAVNAQEHQSRIPALRSLLLPPPALTLEKLPGLKESRSRVRRLPFAPTSKVNGSTPRVVIGLDIGSTGSKLVALDAEKRQTVWEGYRRTLGDPVGAAQELLRQFRRGPGGICPVVAFGATGSGREITGSLLASCFGKESVFVVNEIVAHATGALHYDARVDTIFEIGGQDAKYIRLSDGRVVDCAMNEACSAGTGSFIEEQGRKFAGIQDVAELGRLAMTADCGVSLGQHCSVFMAEVIDEAVASGVSQPEILSGLYDSIIKNYLNRVKGNRSVGKVIFCQGMPFAADALAAAVARQTGSEVIVPPNPGTVGALGIALLALRELRPIPSQALDPERFLSAKVEQKDTFVCRATTGCGGAGNRCRIERLKAVAGGQRSTFTWGGGCALHDKATRKRKLPDHAPDPFREREELMRRIMREHEKAGGRPRIALSDEFMLKGLLPFFAAFFDAAGFGLEWVSGADQVTLKRGIQLGNVSFCAPFQLFHGVAERLLETDAEYLFVPMLRSLPAAPEQKLSVVCPIVQAGPNLLGGVLHPLRTSNSPRWLSPVIDFGVGGLDSAEFLGSCGDLGAMLGLSDNRWREAWRKGSQAQKEFDAACQSLGRATLAFCREQNLVPIVILGRAYTIYNTTLNSNVPAIVREQGAIPIPVDCYPTDPKTPVFSGVYWGYGQTSLRAAHQVRRAQGVYALYCSNYSCGPDSFSLHFASYIMEGKPFAVIETDGHSGDAGTRTRIEAFLHCVEEDRRAACEVPLNDFTQIHPHGFLVGDYKRRDKPETVLVPHMGPSSDVVAAVLRAQGLRAESLTPPDAESLRLGRRHTSGKECLPLPLTLGSILQRLERSRPEECFIILIPTSAGPCRFGVYHLLSQIVLERLGGNDRVHFWSPSDNNYFTDLAKGAEILTYTAILAGDLLGQARLETRPFENRAGGADQVYVKYFQELLKLVESAGPGGASLCKALWTTGTGQLFGIPSLLRRAGADYQSLRSPGERPRVELTGEIYVRGVGFSNDFLIEKLESHGLVVRLAPVSEWLAYCSHLRRNCSGSRNLLNRLSACIEHRVDLLCWQSLAATFGWPSPTPVGNVLETAKTYVNPALYGEAVLTVGAAVHAWRRSQIDAVVNVGPLECMPGKIAEAQLYEAARREGLLSLSLSFDGSPVNSAAVDNFAYEVHRRWRQKQQSSASTPGDAPKLLPATNSQHQKDIQMAEPAGHL